MKTFYFECKLETSTVGFTIEAEDSEEAKEKIVTIADAAKRVVLKRELSFEESKLFCGNRVHLRDNQTPKETQVSKSHG